MTQQVKWAYIVLWTSSIWKGFKNGKKSYLGYNMNILYRRKDQKMVIKSKEMSDKQQEF